MKGRKRKPAALSKMDGNPGGHKLREDPDVEAMIDMTPPGWLDAVAKKEWRVVAPHLAKLNLLSVIDSAGLSAYCRAYSQWREAEERLIKMRKPSATEKSRFKWRAYRELIKDSIQLADRLRHILTEFGLTPVSRCRLSVDPAEKNDPFADFLKKGGASTPKEKKGASRSKVH